jgi:methylmalonyl-CoA/ethylmalonyl-CoA epimerase
VFHDYRAKNHAAGVQHLAFQLPVLFTDRRSGPSNCPNEFFDPDKTMGVATEIMGITTDGRKAIEKMKAEQ